MGNGANTDANTYVTQAEVKDGKIELTVQVDDFKPGEAVEISGQVTQDNGAFATFYDIQNTPNPKAVGTNPGTAPATDPGTAPAANPGNVGNNWSGNWSGNSSLSVTAHPVDLKKFDDTQPITVVARVSRVWSTVLSPPDPTKPAAIWKATEGVSAKALHLAHAAGRRSQVLEGSPARYAITQQRSWTWR